MPAKSEFLQHSELILDTGIDKACVPKILRIVPDDIVNVGVNYSGGENIAAGIQVTVEPEVFIKTLVVIGTVSMQIDKPGIFKIRCKKNRENFILVLTIC